MICAVWNLTHWLILLSVESWEMFMKLLVIVGLLTFTPELLAIGLVFNALVRVVCCIFKYLRIRALTYFLK